MSDVLPDLTTWTRRGLVDIVVVDRFLAGDHHLPLTPQREVVVHLAAEGGYSSSRIAEWLHENDRSVTRTLETTTAPVDRLGRPFHLTRRAS